MRAALTNHVQVVGVVDGPVLVLHYARVVALVRRHHALHDEAPVLVTDLGMQPDTLGSSQTEFYPPPFQKNWSLNN